MADLDRKVRPIYDALDARNWKKGVQLADAALAKWKGSKEEAALICVLKAVGLQRQGRTQEAVQVCDMVREGKPTDEHLLQTMMLVYKPAGEMGKMAEAYEAAGAVNPNEDTQRQLFGIYIRCGNLVKQQQVAMKLNRAFGGDSYIWWVIVTTLLQARTAFRSSSAAMNPAQLLKLASTMIGRQKQKTGRDAASHEQLLVFLDVMHAEGRHSEALEALRGDAGALASIASERELLQAHCLERMGRAQEAAEVYKACWEANPDDLALAKLYMDCRLSGTRKGAPGETSHLLVGVRGGVDVQKRRCEGVEEQVADGAENGEDWSVAAAEVQVVVDAVVAATSVGHHLQRGPFLAAVELAARKHALHLQNGLESESTAKALADAMIAYFRVASTKISCAADLRAYAPVLAGRPQLAERVVRELQAATEEGSEVGTDVNDEMALLRRRVAAAQLKHDLNLANSPESALPLMELYTSALPLSADIDERDRGPGYELVSLAVSALMSRGASGAGGGALHNAVAALLVARAGAAERPFSPNIRIAASMLFGLLGCPQAARKEFSSLDVKNIQHSSVTVHLLFPLILLDTEAGRQGKLKRLLNEVLSVHEEHIRDAGDTILMSYVHDSYSKVMEFSAFAERLRDSHSRFLAASEHVAATLRDAAAFPGGRDLKLAALEGVGEMEGRGLSVTAGEGSAALCDVWSTMRFNEDLTVRPNWALPTLGSVSLGVAEWWEQHRKAPVNGYGCCWWSAHESAEGGAVEAATMRDSLVKALRLRCALPQCLNLALAAISTPEEGAALEAILTTLLPSLPTADNAHDVPSMLATIRRGGGLGSGSLSREADLCSFLLWALACGLGQAVAGGAESLLTAASAALSAQLHYVSRHARGLLEDAGLRGLLPGDALAVASLLLQEGLSWATACLEVWAADLKASRKRSKGGKKAASAAVPGAAAGVEAAVHAVAGLCEAATEALNCLSAALQGAEQAAGAATAAEIVATLEAEHPAALWSWSSSSSAAEVVGAVVQEQRQQLSCLVGTAADRLERVKAAATHCT